MMRNRLAIALRGPGGRVLVVACVAAAWIAAGCALTGGPARPWTYFDDFSTNAAEWDSETHSAFLDSIPDIPGPSFLMYEDDGTGNRKLAFHPGGWVDDTGAALVYRLPLDARGGAVDGGLLEFDLARMHPTGGTLRLDVSYDGAGGGFSEVLTGEAHRSYVLIPAAPASAVTVAFHGLEVTLDNLRVSLFRSPVPGPL